MTPESFIEPNRLASFEMGIISHFRRLEGPILTGVMTLFTRLGDAKSWVTFSLGWALFEWDLKCSGIGIGLAALTGAMIAKAVKYGMKRHRPCFYKTGPQSWVEIPDPYSFPSGHTTTAFCVFGLMLTMGAPSSLFWLFFAIGIGLSRIYLGVHFPSDVLVGMLLGVACGSILASPLLPFFY